MVLENLQRVARTVLVGLEAGGDNVRCADLLSGRACPVAKLKDGGVLAQVSLDAGGGTVVVFDVR